MTQRQRYERRKRELLSDEAICKENREIFFKFLAYEEYKLKRMNGLAALDEKSFKTLNDYVCRLRTVQRWFANKPWIDLTKDDIQKVYDGVEDGTILTSTGKPFKRAETYYRKILKSKPFEMAGMRQLAREVMEFRGPNNDGEVRFIREATFRELVEVAIKLEHKAMLWMAWDIGENVSSLLRLRKRDCRREINPETNEPEYYVNLRREILKRSRTPRTEVTNYRETVRFLDTLLPRLGDDEILFRFTPRMAAKVLARTVRITCARCIPNNEIVTLKDLRSSMACDLLSKGWTTDEVNQRLGHKPSSREIDKYVNWLALDRKLPKRKFHENQVALLTRELGEVRHRETLLQQRMRALQSNVEQLRERINANNRLMYDQVVKLLKEAG